MKISLRRHVPAFALALTMGLAACSSAPSLNSAPAPTPTPTLPPERIADIVATFGRSAADRTNDIRRKPAQMLEFIGIRPGITALDLSAGGGYTTELLARAIGPDGTVYGQSQPRDANREPPKPAASEGASSPPSAMPPPAVHARRSSAEALVERDDALQREHAGAARIVPVSRKFDDPIPPQLADAKLDLVTLMFNYHDLGYMGVDRAAMNRAVFLALKPGGFYVIADHAGRPGTGISESGTLHRIEEAFLVREVEAAGFKLAATGDFLRNPADPRDKNTPNPSQPKDEFVLKFVKP